MPLRMNWTKERGHAQERAWTPLMQSKRENGRVNGAGPSDRDGFLFTSGGAPLDGSSPGKREGLLALSLESAFRDVTGAGHPGKAVNR
jgi:hypothetical protein